MPGPAPFSYDEVPYIKAAFAQTHPGRLATLATLFGMRPPPLQTCRVLELGCASGDNLIPMALVLPEARFLGIDLSARQIEQGRQTIAALGLANIELRHADIADVDAAYGKFDYILSHGIYSWVPQPIREKLLAICRDNLVPDGVAYVSYNTLPGWTMRRTLREMLAYHSRHAQSAAERIEQARAMMDFLARNLPPETPYSALLRIDLDGLVHVSDASLFHDQLEEVNEPVYFHQFAAAAQRHRMQFLAEAEFVPANLPPAVTREIQNMSADVVAMQQYIDFLDNRSFRQSLIVHQDARINRKLNALSVQEFQIACPGVPTSPTTSVAQGIAESFSAPNGATLSTPSALTKAALLTLIERWPLALPFAELVTAARARQQENAGKVDATTLVSDTQKLGDEILPFYAAGVLELRVWSPRVGASASERPTASPLARLQAAQGEQVTNLLHQSVTLDGLNRVLLPLLDGSRDRDALVAALAQRTAEGALNVRQQGAVLTPGPVLDKVLRDALAEYLPKLARSALLL